MTVGLLCGYHLKINSLIFLNAKIIYLNKKMCNASLTCKDLCCIVNVRVALHVTVWERRISVVNKVKELREGLGLSQKQLGEQVNVSRQAINAIETGKYDPSLWLAYNLAKLFGRSIEDIFLFKESDQK
jgi:putative transcriptional regulator